MYIWRWNRRNTKYFGKKFDIPTVSCQQRIYLFIYWHTFIYLCIGILTASCQERIYSHRDLIPGMSGLFSLSFYSQLIVGIPGISGEGYRIFWHRKNPDIPGVSCLWEYSVCRKVIVGIPTFFPKNPRYWVSQVSFPKKTPLECKVSSRVVFLLTTYNGYRVAKTDRMH